MIQQKLFTRLITNQEEIDVERKKIADLTKKFDSLNYINWIKKCNDISITFPIYETLLEFVTRITKEINNLDVISIVYDKEFQNCIVVYKLPLGYFCSKCGAELIWNNNKQNFDVCKNCNKDSSDTEENKLEILANSMKETSFEEGKRCPYCNSDNVSTYNLYGISEKNFDDVARQRYCHNCEKSYKIKKD